jgi:hypothetical protein
MELSGPFCKACLGGKNEQWTPPSLNLLHKTTDWKKKKRLEPMAYPCRLRDHIQVLPKSGDF